MNTEIAKKSEEMLSFEDQLRQAEMFIKSGFFPRHIDTPQKAIVIIQKGKELGLPKTEALSKISVINGQPCTKVETLLALARRTRELEDLQIKDFPDHCEVTIKRKGQSPHTCRFGDKEAAEMGLSAKDNYKKQKGTMYQWRALAKNLRITFPDAIGGLYLEEEIADDVLITPTENPQVTEVVQNPPPIAEPQCKPADESNGHIPDDQLGNWLVPAGKYAGMRLIDVIGQVTETGRNVGIEWLEKAAETSRDPKAKEIISRFLEIIKEQ